VNSTDPEASLDTEPLQRDRNTTQPVPRTPGSVWVPEVKRDAGDIFSALSHGENLLADPFAQPSSELSYVCVLIPRFSDHHLIGDITGCLAEWMKQICVSYGWRLSAITIRPGYLQWVMSVPLNTNPAHFMKVFRQHTSQKILDDFPRFKQINMSNQFWAPGNFVSAGDQLQTPETVNQYILQTRRHQGLI
jgi:REP element-mobilizing transposase RayT